MATSPTASAAGHALCHTIRGRFPGIAGPLCGPRVRPGLGDNPRDRDARLADGLKALPRILRQTTPNQRTDRWWDSCWQRADGGSPSMTLANVAAAVSPV